jgi:hypothetical protein
MKRSRMSFRSFSAGFFVAGVAWREKALQAVRW